LRPPFQRLLLAQLSLFSTLIKLLEFGILDVLISWYLPKNTDRCLRFTASFTVIWLFSRLYRIDQIATLRVREWTLFEPNFKPPPVLCTFAHGRKLNMLRRNLDSHLEEKNKLMTMVRTSRRRWPRPRRSGKLCMYSKKFSDRIWEFQNGTTWRQYYGNIINITGNKHRFSRRRISDSRQTTTTGGYINKRFIVDNGYDNFNTLSQVRQW